MLSNTAFISLIDTSGYICFYLNKGFTEGYAAASTVKFHFLGNHVFTESQYTEKY